MILLPSASKLVIIVAGEELSNTSFSVRMCVCVCLWADICLSVFLFPFMCVKVLRDRKRDKERDRQVGKFCVWKAMFQTHRATPALLIHFPSLGFIAILFLCLSRATVFIIFFLLYRSD